MKQLLTALLVTFALPVQAVAPEWQDSPLSPVLQQARTSIEAEDWQTAEAILLRAVMVEPLNADGWSLLGFTHRKQAKFDQSEDAYTRALELDPNHLGALEYQGELFLMTDRRDDALRNLQRLNMLCPTGCEELDELREAIQLYTGSL